MILDTNRPHTGVGPEDDEGYLWFVQDGDIYTWSESNCQYELAWWLNRDGTVNTHCTPNVTLLESIVRDRPFDCAWLI